MRQALASVQLASPAVPKQVSPMHTPLLQIRAPHCLFPPGARLAAARKQAGTLLANALPYGRSTGSSRIVLFPDRTVMR